MPKLTKADAVRSGNFRLPSQRYQVRILDASYGLSKSSNNPMATLNCEIAGKDGDAVIEDEDGVKCEIGGVEFKGYVTITPKTIETALQVWDRLGNHVEELNTDENIDVKWMKGLIVEWILGSRQSIAKGKDNKPILDADGKEVSRGWEIIADPKMILGLSKVAYGEPKPF